MNERVDTLGWDVVIGMPLALANDRLSQDAALCNLRFDFDASDATSSAYIRGLAQRCDLSNGEGVYCGIELQLREGELGWSGPGEPMQRYPLAGMCLSLMFPVDVSSDNLPETSGQLDTLHWQCSGNGEQDERLSLHVSDWADVAIAERLKTFFRSVLTEGFSEHSLTLQQRILAVLHPQACIRTDSGGTLCASRRTACLIKDSEAVPCLVLLTSLSGVSPDTALPEDLVRRLQPVVPSALEVKDNALSVLIGSQRLPGGLLPALVCEVFERAQRMPALIGEDSLLAFAYPCMMNAASPDAFSSQSRSSSEGEVALNRSCDLILRDQETSWFVTITTLRVVMSEDKLQLFYRWYPTHLPLMHQQVTQLFTLDAGISSLEKNSTAVAFRLTHETTENECGFLLSAPVEWYSDRVQLPWRIAAALQSHQTLISLKLFDALPLTIEHRYVNGGLFIFSALNR